jgi:hypothetical protein
MTAKASAALCAFVHEKAPPHYATSDGPTSWAELRNWYQAHCDRAHAYGECLVIPVFDGGCDNTIYADAKTNHAFRAWHDYLHISNGYSFARGDEIKVGLMHMQQARRAGLPQSDLNMIIADTIGQSEYYFAHGEYVTNQSAFVAAVLRDGLKAVIDSNLTY